MRSSGAMRFSPIFGVVACIMKLHVISFAGLVAVMITCAGCLQTKSNVSAQKSTHLYVAAYDDVASYLKNNCKDFRMKYVKEESRGVFLFSAGTTAKSFLSQSLFNVLRGGDKVTVVVTEKAADLTGVQVSSYGTGQIGPDFGRNNKNVGSVLKALDSRFKAAGIE